MSSDEQRISVRVDGQPEIEGILSDVDNQSEFIRDAIREAAWKRQNRYPDLPDKEAQAYQWLVDNFGGKRVVRDRLLPSLAEHLSLKKDLVDYQILRKLDERGYVYYRNGIVKIRFPSEVPDDE
jgi:hypothetical protein